MQPLISSAAFPIAPSRSNPRVSVLHPWGYHQPHPTPLLMRVLLASIAKVGFLWCLWTEFNPLSKIKCQIHLNPSPQSPETTSSDKVTTRQKADEIAKYLQAKKILVEEDTAKNASSCQPSATREKGYRGRRRKERAWDRGQRQRQRETENYLEWEPKFSSHINPVWKRTPKHKHEEVREKWRRRSEYKEKLPFLERNSFIVICFKDQFLKTSHSIMAY